MPSVCVCHIGVFGEFGDLVLRPRRADSDRDMLQGRLLLLCALPLSGTPSASSRLGLVVVYTAYRPRPSVTLSVLVLPRSQRVD